MAPSGADRAAVTPLVAVVGPTASGKSALAMALAERLGAEIVVADSRQVYRGMDLGTAKPSPAERRRIPHHLLDVATPDQPFSVADWVRLARAAVDEVAGRGRLPMLVGGTGLYVSALVDGFDFDAQPGPSTQLRSALAAELEAAGVAPLAERLTALAPEVAARTDLRNPRRVLRALERESGGGSPPGRSAWSGPLVLLALDLPRELLYRRIDARAAELFASGLVDEVRALLAAGYTTDLTPMSGHGYAEAARVATGEWTVEQAVEVTARRTRQYAKRQLTWFRADPRVTWLPAGERTPDDPELVARAVELVRAAISASAG